MGPKSTSSQREPGTPISTIIGPDATLHGDIHSRSALRVNGEVFGSIENEGDVFVAKGSVVRGDVKGERVTVAGVVEGNIVAKDTLEITAEVKVTGDIFGEILSIQEGAIFRGRVNVSDPAEKEIPVSLAEVGSANGHAEIKEMVVPLEEEASVS